MRNKFDKPDNDEKKKGNSKYPDDVYMAKKLAEKFCKCAYSSS